MPTKKKVIVSGNWLTRVFGNIFDYAVIVGGTTVTVLFMVWLIKILVLEIL